MKVSLDSKTLEYDIDDDSFISGVPLPLIVKYLKGVYTNKQRFMEYFIKPYKKLCTMHDKSYRHGTFDLMASLYDTVKPYSYKEAFLIENSTFKSVVFGSINIAEMVEFLGVERISVEGKLLNLRVYDELGNYRMEENNVIYELHKTNLSKIGANEDAYLVKCWCTSTNKEHWLWVETEYAKKGALEAIASTFRVHKNMIPYIETIKRQGDVLLFEMSQEVEPSGEIVPLTASQYFSLLVSQS